MLLGRLRVWVALATIGCLSCATGTPPVGALDFFKRAPADDPWNRKIADWQLRHEQDVAATANAQSYDSDLARDYAGFTKELRRRIVEEAVRFTQSQSRHVYEPDGDEDHWATLGEVLENGRDDCDGLELLTFRLLRDFGFESREIVRSIVVHEESGQHHMVTLWFEQGEADTDPFVLDPTGIVAEGLVRLSDVGEWQPIETFDEEAHYRVEERAAPASVGGTR